MTEVNSAEEENVTEARLEEVEIIDNPEVDNQQLPEISLSPEDELKNIASAATSTETEKWTVAYEDERIEYTFNGAEDIHWDDTDLLESALSKFANIAPEAVSLKPAQSVTLYYVIELVDNYGNLSTSPAITIIMETEEINKYNFKNLEGNSFFEKFEPNAVVDIAPGILKGVDFDNINVYL